MAGVMQRLARPMLLRQHTPLSWTGLETAYPHSQLLTSGPNVGLPEGQMGNSEVGHLNIGAGRIVLQELALINAAIAENTIDTNRTLKKLFGYCVDNNKCIHFAGLVSDGGVHAHSNHLIKLCKLARQHGVRKIYIHAFTDGRDTDPHGALGYLEDLQSQVAVTGARIATVVGRYFAMDRDNRWERIKKAYDLLVHGLGKQRADLSVAIQESYQEGITDEFIQPIVITEQDQPLASIREGDAMLCFNFRTDRCRQLSIALTQKEFPEFKLSPIKLQYVTMTRYDDSFKDIGVVFEKTNLENTLGEVLAQAGLRQLRISETEKYPHVTYFFSGGREKEFPGEQRILIPSPKVATYDLKPAMSALEVKNAVVAELQHGGFDFVCINFANPDMVSHTGDFKAATKAIETVDGCVEEIVKAGIDHGYCFLITSDHGNAEMMINTDGSPNTAHTTNPVPCFYLAGNTKGVTLENGLLADLAPTILSLLGIAIPAEMTGKTLLKS